LGWAMAGFQPYNAPLAMMTGGACDFEIFNFSIFEFFKFFIFFNFFYPNVYTLGWAMAGFQPYNAPLAMMTGGACDFEIFKFSNFQICG
jgi:hypothetical protein